jgi:hypothetical protein
MDIASADGRRFCTSKITRAVAIVSTITISTGMTRPCDLDLVAAVDLWWLSIDIEARAAKSYDRVREDARDGEKDGAAHGQNQHRQRVDGLRRCRGGPEDVRDRVQDVAAHDRNTRDIPRRRAGGRAGPDAGRRGSTRVMLSAFVAPEPSPRCSIPGGD